MTTITIEDRGERVILARDEWEKLRRLARKSDNVEIDSTAVEEEEVSDCEWLLTAQQGGAFDWLHDEPDLYSLDDCKVRYR